MNDGGFGWIVAFIIFAMAQWGSYFDDNKIVRNGGDFGLPDNCRAYVQATIDGIRSQEYDVHSGLAGLERNCGRFGNLWKNERN